MKKKNTIKYLPYHVLPLSFVFSHCYWGVLKKTKTFSFNWGGGGKELELIKFMFSFRANNWSPCLILILLNIFSALSQRIYARAPHHLNGALRANIKTVRDNVVPKHNNLGVSGDWLFFHSFIRSTGGACGVFLSLVKLLLFFFNFVFVNTRVCALLLRLVFTVVVVVLYGF